MRVRIDFKIVIVVFEAHNGLAPQYQICLVSALGSLGYAGSSFLAFLLRT